MSTIALAPLRRAWVILPLGLLATIIAYTSSRSPLVAIAGLAAAILLILVITRPYALLLLLVAALPWEGLLSYPSETLSIVKMLGLLLFGSTALSIARGHRQLHAPSIGYAVFMFLLLVGASLLFSPDLAGGLGKTIRYALFGAFFFIIVQLVTDRRQLGTVIQVVATSAAIAALYGLVSFLTGSVQRASGPISDPNDFGYLLAATLPLFVYLAARPRASRWLYGAGIPVLLAAMLATLSRGVIVSLAAALLWALATRRISIGGVAATSTVGAAVVVIGLLAFAPLINEQVERKGKVAEQNVASREALWEGAVELAMDRPVLGFGPGGFESQSVDYVRDNPIVLKDPVVHNTYLEILAESGPFALAAFVAFLAGTWISLGRENRQALARSDGDGAWLTSALKASMIVAIVGGFFLSEQLGNPFWLLGGLAAAGPRALSSPAAPEAETDDEPAVDRPLGG